MGGSNKLIKLHRRYSKPDYHDQWQARTRIYSSEQGGEGQHWLVRAISHSLFSLEVPSLHSLSPSEETREGESISGDSNSSRLKTSLFLQEVQLCVKEKCKVEDWQIIGGIEPDRGRVVTEPFGGDGNNLYSLLKFPLFSSPSEEARRERSISSDNYSSRLETSLFLQEVLLSVKEKC